jgi:hypothetical protein
MTRGLVLDPTQRAIPTSDGATANLPVGVPNPTVGLRLDIMWRSWDWITEEWERALAGRGSEVRTVRTGARFGDDGDRTDRDVDVWAGEVDLAVVGLAN